MSEQELLNEIEALEAENAWLRKFNDKLFVMMTNALAYFTQIEDVLGTSLRSISDARRVYNKLVIETSEAKDEPTTNDPIYTGSDEPNPGNVPEIGREPVSGDTGSLSTEDRISRPGNQQDSERPATPDPRPGLDSDDSRRSRDGVGGLLENTDRDSTHLNDVPNCT